MLKRLFRRHPKRIGIALSGGATHGAAHIGVLRVLQSAGILPGIVTGTSAGAIVGAAYAAGVDIEEISHLFGNASWPKLAKIAWKDSLSLFNTQPMEEFIKDKIGDYSFDQLPRKFACVACDILRGEKIIFDQGPVAMAVRASSAVPGVFSPVPYQDKLLIDGGVIDNLPVELARKMGADYVIAVDLSKPVRLSKKPANIMEIFFAVTNLMQVHSAFPDPGSADCHIHPRVEDLSAWSFGDSSELERRGEISTRAVLDQLKRDLGIKKS